MTSLPPNDAPPGESRRSFFDRIRAEVRRDPAAAPPVPEPDPAALELARVCPPGDRASLVREFTRRAGDVGMRTYACEPHRLGACIAETLAPRGVRTCAFDAPVLARYPAAADAARAAGISPVLCSDAAGAAPAAPGFRPFFACDAGVALADAGVAESGSLVVRSGPGRPRAITLVPPISVVILPAPAIVPDLLDLFAPPGVAPAHADTPASTVLITGPSKTADIEGVLITGVHGPREVHVIVVTDEP